MNESDDLPTKLCLNCEEKVVTFQLFVLECLKAQETLKKMCVGPYLTCPIKYEDGIEFALPPIKSEVSVRIICEDRESYIKYNIVLILWSNIFASSFEVAHANRLRGKD